MSCKVHISGPKTAFRLVITNSPLLINNLNNAFYKNSAKEVALSLDSWTVYSYYVIIKLIKLLFSDEL